MQMQVFADCLIQRKRYARGVSNVKHKRSCANSGLLVRNISAYDLTNTKNCQAISQGKPDVNHIMQTVPGANQHAD